MNMLDNLKEQGVSESLIKDIEHFRKEYDVKDELKERVTKSPAFFIGKDILEMCITGILEEENILLYGVRDLRFPELLCGRRGRVYCAFQLAGRWF